MTLKMMNMKNGLNVKEEITMELKCIIDWKVIAAAAAGISTVMLAAKVKAEEAGQLLFNVLGKTKVLVEKKED